MADLVLRLVGDDGADINGQFLWIEDGLQPPMPRWSERTESPQSYCLVARHFVRPLPGCAPVL